MKRAIILLSGGLDSTVAAYLTAEEAEIILAITFDYGQKAAPAEIRAAATTCRSLSIPHKVMALPWLAELTATALVNPQMPVPSLSPDELDQAAITQKTAAAVWVPNRNGLFLNIAAAYAESLPADCVVAGFNAEEGTTFPDNSAAFVAAANQFFALSTLRRPALSCPTQEMDKTVLVKSAISLKIAWDQVWPCYLNDRQWCGRCESCARSKRAFANAGVKWPC